MTNNFSSTLKDKLIQTRSGDDAIVTKHVANLQRVVTGFYLLPPDYAKSGKLQLGFRADLQVLQHAHLAEFETFPADIQNLINAIAFLYACFKFHGLCENNDNYPIIQGDNKLEHALVLDDGEGDEHELGHSYDLEKFAKPILHCEPIFRGNVLVDLDHFTQKIKAGASETSLVFLTHLLNELCGLKQRSEAYKSSVYIAPHGVPRR